MPTDSKRGGSEKKKGSGVPNTRTRQDPAELEAAEARMPFFDHIDEFRVRLMNCLYVFVGGFLFCYFLTNPYVFDFLKRPLFELLPPEQQKLYFTSLFENFMTHLKLAGYSSVVLFCPFYFYQIWAFIAPGLHPHERRMVFPFLLSTAFFFIAGALFAYYVLFPVGFKFFLTFGGASDVPLLTIDAYYTTCLKLMLLFGIAFELPVLIVFLGFLGIIDADFLKRQRKNAIIAITVVSGVAAPPDAISMLILMAPLVLMYETSIHVVSWLTSKRQKRNSGSKESTDNPLTGESR